MNSKFRWRTFLRLLATSLGLVVLVIIAGTYHASKNPDLPVLAGPDERGIPPFAQWLPVKSEAGRFSVRMPLKPKKSQKAIESRAGSLTIYSFAAEVSGNRAFTVMYLDYPPEIIKPELIEKQLMAMRDRAVGTNGIVIYEKELDLKIGSGIEIQWEKPDLKSAEGTVLFTGRFYLAGARVYMLIALEPKQKTSAQSVNQFFNSFEIQ